MSTTVVISCTSRKAFEPSDQMRFSTMPRLASQALAEEWLKRAENEDKYLAPSVYAGLSWSQVRAITVEKRSPDLRLLIASAGFGLLADGESIPTYSATFSQHSDSISNHITDGGSAKARNSVWWSTVNQARSKSATPLATGSEDGIYLIAVGAPYFQAMESDIQALFEKVGKDRLFLVCAGIRHYNLSSDLANCLLPISGQTQSIFKCPLLTLNVRIAREIIQVIVPRCGWDRLAISEMLRSTDGTKQPIHAKRSSQRMTDSEVKSWVNSLAEQQGKLGYSAALKALRESGRACEQARFRRLYDEVSPR